MANLTVLILAYNEEKHIERAIESVRRIAEHVVVIDSYSSDRTVELAEKSGARVLQNRFSNQSQQFCWALEHSNILTDWVMRLDADEYIMADLSAAISAQLGNFPSDVTGINLKRRHIFLGRWIRHGGRYPLLLLRIWRNGKGVMEERWMDEHLFLSEGRAVTLDGGFVDHNLNDLTAFIDKHNRYATREALEVIGRKYALRRSNTEPLRSGSFQMKIKRNISDRVFNRLPLGLSSTAYFLYRYFLLLGFLDGKEGMIYHFLQGYWYRFLVAAKVHEIESHFRPNDDNNTLREKIFTLTGYRLSSDCFTDAF